MLNITVNYTKINSRLPYQLVLFQFVTGYKFNTTWRKDEKRLLAYSAVKKLILLNIVLQEY